MHFHLSIFYFHDSLSSIIFLQPDSVENTNHVQSQTGRTSGCRQPAFRRYLTLDVRLTTSYLMVRDDFSPTTINRLARRVSCLCSNPHCSDPFTSLPNSVADKYTNLGIAAHICAASPRGPRYDASQTPSQRRSIQNAIWLCQRCAAEIDRDIVRYTVSLLREWKASHEEVLSSPPRRAQLFHGSSSRPASEVTVARDILHFFADRRMLFEGYAWEVPQDIMHSVDMVRQELTSASRRVSQQSNLLDAIQALQSYFYHFLRQAGDLSSRQQGLDSVSSDNIRNALAELRRDCGVQLAAVGAAYKLPIPATLQHICS